MNNFICTDWTLNYNKKDQLTENMKVEWRRVTKEIEQKKHWHNISIKHIARSICETSAMVCLDESPHPHRQWSLTDV
jgi:hypothetical protein